MTDKYPGCLYIVAAPSGGGKTSLVKKLVGELEDIAISISHTTRQMRPGEKNGVDYFFVDDHTFLKMVGEGAFVEHAQVFGHFYGTSAAQITDRLKQGIDIVLDIDWQGALQIRHLFPESVSIFVVPPSLEVLSQRLKNRQQDNEAVVNVRMQSAQEELSHYPEFDYLIINDDFEKAAGELKAIVIANRLRMARQVCQQRKLLSFLLASQ
jgi:guanylate kinase